MRSRSASSLPKPFPIVPLFLDSVLVNGLVGTVVDIGFVLIVGVVVVVVTFDIVVIVVVVIVFFNSDNCVRYIVIVKTQYK